MKPYKKGLTKEELKHKRALRRKKHNKVDPNSQESVSSAAAKPADSLVPRMENENRGDSPA